MSGEVGPAPKTLRGASFDHHPLDVRASYRTEILQDDRNFYAGFRCVGKNSSLDTCGMGQLGSAAGVDPEKSGLPCHFCSDSCQYSLWERYRGNHEQAELPHLPVATEQIQRNGRLGGAADQRHFAFSRRRADPLDLEVHRRRSALLRVLWRSVC